MKIDKETIREYSEKYNKRYSGTNDELTEREAKGWFRENKYLNRDMFLKIALWKSKRPRKHYEENDELMIKEITEFSLKTKSDQARIEVLQVLKGVSYPVASAILHFAFPDKYPILDFRVLWSLGIEQPKQYAFSFWEKYCDKIKGISNKTGEGMRTVDKALWEYSKENQL